MLRSRIELNQNGDPMCIIDGCRRHKQVWYINQEPYCIKHIPSLDRKRIFASTPPPTRKRSLYKSPAHSKSTPNLRLDPDIIQLETVFTKIPTPLARDEVFKKLLKIHDNSMENKNDSLNDELLHK